MQILQWRPASACSAAALPTPHPTSLTPLCRYLGKIAFGEALRSNAEVSATFGVRSYPTLLVVCGGNRDVVVKYDGELSSSQQGAGLGVCGCQLCCTAGGARQRLRDGVSTGPT